MDYTWAQFTAYLRLARRRHAQRELSNFVHMRHAFAGGDGAKALHAQLVKALER